jgi:hypothetical protein
MGGVAQQKTPRTENDSDENGLKRRSTPIGLWALKKTTTHPPGAISKYFRGDIYGQTGYIGTESLKFQGRIFSYIVAT